jgi:predicted phosphodiesterase
MTKVDVAREFRNVYGMDIPTLKLARIMYSKNNLLFKNIEDARVNLRRIEGKTGKKSIRGNTKVTHPTPDRPRNPYNLPKSDEARYEPYIIKGHKRVAVFSDIHVPYHSIEAITAAIQFCKKEKPDALLLNGDTIDCHRLSRFVKDPNKRNFAGELETFKGLIEIFKKQLKCKIYFKVGNHEERYEHFLYEKAGELVGVEEFSFENIIKSRAEGIDVISDKRIIKLGGLNIIHGHEFNNGFFSPVNVARGLFLRGKTSALQGHNHQTSSHTESDMNGKIMTTWSTGCMCELHPAYAPINKWNWGFAVINIDGESFDVDNKRVYKGEVY